MPVPLGRSTPIFWFELSARTRPVSTSAGDQSGVGVGHERDQAAIAQAHLHGAVSPGDTGQHLLAGAPFQHAQRNLQRLTRLYGHAAYTEVRRTSY